VICNPPFHNSKENAAKSALRKVNNLQENRTKTPILNFGGQQTELWCEGGELGFITQMIYESAKYPMQVLWFSTLVSKKENLPSLYKTLAKVMPASIKTIEMAQGQKNSRIVVWTFQTEKQLKEWKF
jgi:23S rRNA (adenine1618-N6)-methyltransferase